MSYSSMLSLIKPVKGGYLIKSKISIKLVILSALILYYNIFICSLNAAAKTDESIIDKKEPVIKSMVDKTITRPFDTINRILDNNIKHKIEYLDKEEKDYENSKFSLKKDLVQIVSENKRIDTGANFLDQIINYNDRLDYYDLYIKLAKEKGYIVTDYIDYLTKYKNTDKKVLILRHDIDEKSDGTKLMFEIEKKNNVKATYYFRWATYDQDLINEISKAGFEVGLHYETIANYCIKYNKKSLTEEDMEKCRDILKKEIKEFKEKSGINIQTIASHGNPVNKAIGIPNNVLLENQNYSDYGIVSETYDKNILSNYIKSYICDGEIYKNYGFSYKSNPIDSILNNDKVIEFLSHPNHWDYDINERTALFKKYEGNRTSSVKVLKNNS